jgi:exodeoxyribonuclease VII small subunit
MPKKSDTKKDSTDFETSMVELESLVERMEQGDTKLDDALKDFETGIALTRSCRQSLSDAEQKVQILLEQNEQADPENFNDSD